MVGLLNNQSLHILTIQHYDHTLAQISLLKHNVQLRSFAAMQLDVMTDNARVCCAKGRSSDLVVGCTVRRFMILNEVNTVTAILNKENVYRTLSFSFGKNLFLRVHIQQQNVSLLYCLQTF